MLQREEVLVDLADHDRDPVDHPRPVVGPGEGNLFSSKLVASTLHAPALDIDFPCELHESTTPGHFHLYIDVPMSWHNYVRVLGVLADVGIIQRGYASLSIDRGASFLRKPGVEKNPLDWPDS